MTIMIDINFNYTCRAFIIFIVPYDNLHTELQDLS